MLLLLKPNGVMEGIRSYMGYTRLFSWLVMVYTTIRQNAKSHWNT